MITKPHHRQPAANRARKRAIRAQAARAGVPYSVAARQLDSAPDALASTGRTVYPASTDTHRQWLVDSRERRPFAVRLQDARRAADLPLGRAGHLADRFPPTRGEAGTGVGVLYHGARRQEALAALYSVIAAETPGLVPSAGDLAWAAESAEETAVDLVCADLDRAARLLLDDDRTTERDGVRHILDAVLVIADDGHAPGTRVRMLDGGRTGTIVSAVWGVSGPPILYRVHPDAAPRAVVADPRRLMLLHPLT